LIYKQAWIVKPYAFAYSFSKFTLNLNIKKNDLEALNR